MGFLHYIIQHFPSNKHTQERNLWAGPQSGQHLLRLRLFTDKQIYRADEQRSHVAVHALIQKGQRHLKINTIRSAERQHTGVFFRQGHQEAADTK